MKKFLGLICGLIGIMFITSCQAPDGDAYLKYYWSSGSVMISDTNPSLPSVVYNNVYFSTDPGIYYMEYAINDYTGTHAYYMYYRITIEDGKSFYEAGDDSWFGIYLSSAGPSIYKYTSTRSISKDAASDDKENISDSCSNNSEKISVGKKLSEILGTDEVKTEHGTIKISYGKILSD